MNESSLGPCSKCGERPATHHITTIMHGKMEVADLCAECFGETQSAAVRKQMEGLMNGSCIYCGAKAATSLGGMSWLSMFGQAKEEEEERFACHECFQEHHDFFLKRLQVLSAERDGLSEEEQMKQIRAIQHETDAHMRRWISRKLN